MRWLAALVLVGIAIALGTAVPIAAGLPETVVGQDHLDAEWTERLDAAVRSIEEARIRNVKAQATAAEMKRDNHPRGDARAAILKDAEEAERALERAAAALPELLERARREGVSAGTLQGYEDVR